MPGFLRMLWREIRDDRLTGEGARVAYYLFLSLFPVILTVMALAGLVGGDQTFTVIMEKMRTTLPSSAQGILEEFVSDVTRSRDPGTFSIGLLLTLWAASGGFAALGDGMNRMYDLDHGRAWWKQRLVALILAAAGAVVIVGGAVLLVAGPEIFGAIGVGVVWSALRWPAAFLLAAVFFWIQLHWLPDRDQSGSRREITIGALTGTAVWVAGTALFRFYVADVASYNATYGFVGSIIVLMLWMYLTAIAALLGTEIAAVLEARRLGAASGDLRQVRPHSRERAASPMARNVHIHNDLEGRDSESSRPSRPMETNHRLGGTMAVERTVTPNAKPEKDARSVPERQEASPERNPEREIQSPERERERQEAAPGREEEQREPQRELATPAA